MTPADKITMLRAALEQIATDHPASWGRSIKIAAKALAATAEQPEEEPRPHAHGRMFTNEVGQHVSIFIHTLPSGQCELQVTRGSNLPQSIVLSDSEVRAVATISASFVSHAVDGKPVTSQPDAHAKLIEAAQLQSPEPKLAVSVGVLERVSKALEPLVAHDHFIPETPGTLVTAITIEVQALRHAISAKAEIDAILAALAPTDGGECG